MNSINFQDIEFSKFYSFSEFYKFIEFYKFQDEFQKFAAFYSKAMNYQKEKMKAIPFKIASKRIAGVEEDS